MSTFAVVNSGDLLPAVNYLLSNLDTSGNGNVTIPGNVLVANTSTGVISQYDSANVFGYLYQYVNIRYSNNATGTAGFDTNSNNYSYFGVYNNASSTPSANPSAYQWYQVSPPFDSGTSRTLYYSAIGGRQIQWAAASSPPSSSYVVTTANVAIDLDVVTTAAGTPGERGPVAAGYVVTTADPNTATSSQLTTWFEAPRNAVTPPIGLGLTPVSGDTATFTYVAGVGAPTATYTYNGSIWLPADGQVVSGSVIVTGTIAGNAIISNTITATQIAADTITAAQIAGNTITANNIATGTLTTDLFTANTISGNIIQAGSFSANTINGNSIVAGSITAEQLAANALTANTVVSTGATLGDFNSPGFWLQGTTGNARFGNTVSIGNNLTIGNDAQIGGNLNITGLVNGSVLNANTVNTIQVVPASISTGAGVTSFVTQQVAANALPNTYYASNLTLDFTTTFNNQPNFVFAQALVGVEFATIVSASVDVTLQTILYRQNLTTGALTNLFTQDLDVYNVTTADGRTAFFNLNWTGVADTVPAAGNYRYYFSAAWSKSGTTTGVVNMYYMNRNLMVQTLKR